MWADPEEIADTREPATWAQALQSALSGFAICVVIFTVFAAIL